MPRCLITNVRVLKKTCFKCSISVIMHMFLSARKSEVKEGQIKYLEKFEKMC